MKPLHNKFILAGSAALLACSIGLAQPALAATKGVNVYRLYNTWSHEHLYTANLDEYNGLVAKGWNGEGVGFVTPEDGSDQVDGQVYRLFNPNNKEHFYTKDSAEVKRLKTIGWKYEAVAWNSAKPDQSPVYRLFNPYVTEFTHYYTQSITDRDENVARGMRSEAIAWYALNVTPEQNLDDALANLQSILASISTASTTPSSTSSSTYESLDTTLASADSIVMAKAGEIKQVDLEIEAKKTTLTEKQTATTEKKNALTTALATNDIAQIQAAQTEYAAAMADETSVSNELTALKSKKAGLEKDIDEAQCGRANNQYRRISAICTSISNTKQSLEEDVKTLTNDIKVLTAEQGATVYQEKKDEIQKEIDAKTKTKNAKEKAITELNTLLSGYQETLDKAMQARQQEFAVMQQSVLVSYYTDTIAKAQSALEEYKSQVASYNEKITNINNENKGKDGYTPKALINLDNDAGYASATAKVTEFTDLKDKADRARTTARGNAATSRRPDSRTLEEAIENAEKEYSQKVYEILNPKQS